MLGIDHGHIFGMLGHMKAAGCTCARWWSDGQAVTEAKFREVFPDLDRVDDRRRILDDPDIDMVLIAAVPSERAALAIEAMEAGKDVMVDKPGCTTLEQLDAVEECAAPHRPHLVRRFLGALRGAGRHARLRNWSPPAPSAASSRPSASARTD